MRATVETFSLSRGDVTEVVGLGGVRRVLVSRWIWERASAAALRDPWMWQMSDMN